MKHLFILALQGALTFSSPVKAESRTLWNQDGCSALISSEVNASRVPWWGRPLAKRIAASDIEAINNGSITVSQASGNLYRLLLGKGMESGYAHYLANQYSSTLNNILNSRTCS